METCGSVSGAGSRTSKNECEGVESNNSLAICLQCGFPQTEEPEKKDWGAVCLAEIQGKGAREMDEEEESVTWYHMGNWAQF